MSYPRDITPAQEQAELARQDEDLAAYDDWLACVDGAGETMPLEQID